MPSKQKLFSDLFKNITQTSSLITAADLNLGNVNNTADVDKPVSVAQQAALDAKQNILVSGSTIKTVCDRSLLGAGNLSLTKSDIIGIENVDNTSDMDKPVSTAVQSAISTLVHEAPSDGNCYTRKDLSWYAVSVNSSLNLPDAQSDGVLYSRQNGSWVAVPLVAAYNNGALLTGSANAFNFFR